MLFCVFTMNIEQFQLWYSTAGESTEKNTVQVSAVLACRAAQEWERQTQCKSLHWLVERRKSGKDKHSASICSIGLSSGARMGKTNTVQVSALLAEQRKTWERQTQCKSLHWLVERRKSGKDKHSASLCIGLSSGARVGKTNTVQVSALACRAAQEWERQTQCKYLHCLPSSANVGKTNTVQVSALACRAACERRAACKIRGKDKHSASLCIGLSACRPSRLARVGKTNTVQVSALACRAAQEWESQTQCKSLHCLPSSAKVGKTNTVQVSALACRAAQ